MPGYEVFGEEERSAVLEVFELNGGVLFAHGFDAMRNGVYRVREYERAFAERFGFSHSQAVSSGSAAVRVALEAAGVGPGDEVVTQSHTFVATVEAILQLGAVPVIVDIDETLNMDPRALEEAITERTTAVIPVHMMGEMCDMDPIVRIAEQSGLLIVEDCAQALGATYKGAWSGTFGVSAAFSTDAGKTLNTGEGGMVATMSEEIYCRARAFHDHGHSYQPDVGRGNDPASVVGFNYRLTELQAAIGIVQLGKLDYIVSRQRENKALLMERISSLPVGFRKTVDPAGDLGDTVVMILPTRESAAAMVQGLGARGVGTKNLPDAMRWHFARRWQHMLASHPHYQGRFDGMWMPSADILERCVALGVGVNMTREGIERIGEAVTEACLTSI